MCGTELMKTDYNYGDGKSFDLLNSSACKQNWCMQRQCHAAWKSLGPNDHNTGALLNSDRATDVKVYSECHNFFDEK